MDDRTTLLQVPGGKEKLSDVADYDDKEEYVALVQRPPLPPPPRPERPESHPVNTGAEGDDPAESHPTDWMTVAYNFPHGFTMQGLMEILDKILGEILEHSFNLQSQYLTHMAYHAAFYLDKLADLHKADLTAGERPSEPLGPSDSQQSLPEHMTVSFHMANPLSEIEATLSNLAKNYEGLPHRHVRKELVRVQTMLEESRAMLKKWAQDPKAPGALPGLAASGNAIDAVVFANLATEEGGLATMGEAIEVAHQATLRCASYMEELVQWLRGRFAEDPGSPSHDNTGERPSGSNQQPDFGTNPRKPLARSGEHMEQKGSDLPRPKQARASLEPRGPCHDAGDANSSRHLPAPPRAHAGCDPEH